MNQESSYVDLLYLGRNYDKITILSKIRSQIGGYRVNTSCHMELVIILKRKTISPHFSILYLVLGSYSTIITLKILVHVCVAWAFAQYVNCTFKFTLKLIRKI